MQCDDCDKWRRLWGVDEADLPELWTCNDHPEALLDRLSCGTPEEEMDYEEEEMEEEEYEYEDKARVEPDAEVAYDAAEPDGEDVAADQSHAALVSESHGIRLHLSRKSPTGYKGVYRHGLLRYRSQITTGGSDIHLGMYGTAVEAAVAYARAAPSPPKALPEVTEVDGIRLHLASKCTSGYMGVRLRPSGRYEVKIWLGGKGGKMHTLGTYDTAVEGALAYARAAQSHEHEEEDDDVERGPKSDQAKLNAMKSATFGLLPPLATLPLRPPSCFLETDVFKRRAFLEVERLGVGARVTANGHISSYLKCPQVYESNGSLGNVARHSRIVFRAQRHGETRLAYQWEWRNHILDELSANFQHYVIHSRGPTEFAWFEGAKKVADVRQWKSLPGTVVRVLDDGTYDVDFDNGSGGGKGIYPCFINPIVHAPSGEQMTPKRTLVTKAQVARIEHFHSLERDDGGFTHGEAEARARFAIRCVHSHLLIQLER